MSDDWNNSLKPIAVVTRDSVRSAVSKEDGGIEVISRELSIVIIDGKKFMMKKCSKLLECKELFPVKHQRGGEIVYSCAYDVGLGKSKHCSKTHERY